MSDLRRVKQHPDETLRQYIQQFNQVHHKILCASDEAIIMVFTNGVKHVHMCEKLAIHDQLSMALELFNLADKCAKAEEGCLSSTTTLPHP